MGSVVKIEIEIGPDGKAEIKKFLSRIVKGHHDEGCEFPGYSFSISHFPQIQEWSLDVVCGSEAIEIEDAKINVT